MTFKRLARTETDVHDNPSQLEFDCLVVSLANAIGDLQTRFADIDADPSLDCFRELTNVTNLCHSIIRKATLSALIVTRMSK